MIEPSSGQSWIANDRLRLAIEAARAAGFDAPLGSLAAAIFARACDDGCAGLDDASLLAWIRSRDATRTS